MNTTSQQGYRGVMQQYQEAKERHPGMVLLFRMGEYYKAFEEDARTLAKLLGLYLMPTYVGPTIIDVVDFQHQSLENHLHTLIRAKLRVAICDQVA